MLLGGVSIFGGRGTIGGVILALLLLGGIQKALLLSESISSYWIQIVTGDAAHRLRPRVPTSSAASREARARHVSPAAAEEAVMTSR